MEYREPPRDEIAERTIIGCVLLDQNCMARIGCLLTDDFFAPHHRCAWYAIGELSRASKPIDVLTVGDALKLAGAWDRFPGGWQAWAMEAANRVSTTANVDHYAGIVRDKAIIRRLILLCQEVSARCYGGSAGAAELVTEARDGVAAIEAMADVADGSPVKMVDAVSPAITEIANRCDPDKPVRLVTTGLTKFDRIVGGHAPEELIIVAARPGKGKTSWANGVGIHAAKCGVNVLCFSYEMGQQVQMERMISMESGIPASWMRTGRNDSGDVLTLDDHRAMMTAGGKLSKLPLWIDCRMLPLGQLVSTARRWHAMEVAAKGNPVCLGVLDYLQLVGEEAKARETSREQQVARVSHALKWLAKTLHMPWIALCQLNREIEKRGDGVPKLSDLRESGSIEQDADMVIFIDRDTQMDANGEPMQNSDSKGRLIVGKNRNGPVGYFDMWWKAKTMRFCNPEEEVGPSRDGRFDE